MSEGEGEDEQGQDEPEEAAGPPAATTLVRVIREIYDDSGNVIQTQEEDIPEDQAKTTDGVIWGHQ